MSLIEFLRSEFLRSGATLTTARAALLTLSGAVLVSIPTWLYAPEPWRSVILLIGGLAAGAVAMLAWQIFKTPEIALAAKPKSGTGKLLSWTDLAKAIPEPAIVLDRTSIILDFNAAAQAVFERLAPRLALEHVIRDPELIAAVTGAFESNEKRDATLLLRGGFGQRFIATVTPLTPSGHEYPVAALITIRDESGQHRLLEMRTDFIANASHELRTPLASVRGFIETLQGSARHDEVARDRFCRSWRSRPNA